MIRKPMPPLSRNNDRIAILAALSFFLAAIEYMIPKPLPFIRLGLANFPVIISLVFLPAGQIFLLVLLKVLGQSLIQGTLFSYAFLLSFSGSFSSAAVMILLAKAGREKISLIGLSIAGALSSNLSQIFLAKIFIADSVAFLIGPPFLIIGFISSIFLGFLATRFSTISKWLKQNGISGKIS